MQMLYWLKRGIAKNHKELAQLLQRNEATISRWLLKYHCGGLAGTNSFANYHIKTTENWY
ncbi:helix-turn-helix domain-containing protein [Coleofasciculus sp.]|uniref:helix-turn-helix domain-containing protein n=1 Tax=Coleofasciculus sp. TaxID=3100458 RepID=UPI003A217196